MIDPHDPGTLSLSLPAHPASNAERQRKLRQARAAAGVKPLYVSPAERQLLGRALSLFGSTGASSEIALNDVATLMDRVMPGSADRKGLADFAMSMVAGRSPTDQQNALRMEVEQLTVARDRAISDYWRGREEITKLRQENHELKAGLHEILNEVSGGSTLSSAPVAKVPSTATLQLEIAQLQQKLEVEHRKHCDLLAELGIAGQAVERLQNRLRAAGLPGDYRAQPGE